MTHPIGALEALAPCPFCGILPDLRLSQMDRETWMVVCDDSECGFAEVCASTEKEAIGQWNSRRPAQAGPQTGAPVIAENLLYSALNIAFEDDPKWYKNSDEKIAAIKSLKAKWDAQGAGGMPQGPRPMRWTSGMSNAVLQVIYRYDENKIKAETPHGKRVIENLRDEFKKWNVGPVEAIKEGGGT